MKRLPKRPIGRTKGNRVKSDAPAASTIDLAPLRADHEELCIWLLTVSYPLTVSAARAVVLSNADLSAWRLPSNETTLVLIRQSVVESEAAENFSRADSALRDDYPRWAVIGV